MDVLQIISESLDTARIILLVCISCACDARKKEFRVWADVATFWHTSALRPGARALEQATGTDPPRARSRQAGTACVFSLDST